MDDALRLRDDHYDPDWSGDPNWGWGYYLFKSIYYEVTGSRQLIAV